MTKETKINNLKRLNNYAWNVSIKKSALDFLMSLNESMLLQIVAKIENLIKNDQLQSLEKLKHDLDAYRKIKFSKIRAIVTVEIKDKQLVILFAGYRKDVYKKFKNK